MALRRAVGLRTAWGGALVYSSVSFANWNSTQFYCGCVHRWSHGRFMHVWKGNRNWRMAKSPCNIQFKKKWKEWPSFLNFGAVELPHSASLSASSMLSSSMSSSSMDKSRSYFCKLDYWSIGEDFVTILVTLKVFAPSPLVLLKFPEAGKMHARCKSGAISESFDCEWIEWYKFYNSCIFHGSTMPSQLNGCASESSTKTTTNFLQVSSTTTMVVLLVIVVPFLLESQTFDGELLGIPPCHFRSVWASPSFDAALLAVGPVQS
jgi:hypothetical protein